MKGSLGGVAARFGLLGLLVACADLHAPPAAGAAGAAGGESTVNMANAGGSASAAGTSTQGSSGAASGGGSDAASGLGGSASSSQGGSASGDGGTGVTGSSGSSGSSGSGGAGGQGGAGGTPASGASGQAGSGGAPLDCARRDGGDIQLWLHQDITNAQDNEIHPAFLLTRTGLSVPLKELTIRYYFSAEAFGDWVLTCLWVTKAGDMNHGYCDQGGVSMQVVTLDPPRQQADRYLEVSFAGVSNATLSEGFPIEARVMFWRAGHPMLNLANDYSFVPNLAPVQSVGTLVYKQTSKVTLYRKGALVWGEEPCP